MESAQRAEATSETEETTEGEQGPQPGEYDALVFVHGSGDSASTWAALTAHLGELPCVALDLPGHGSLADRPGPARMGVTEYADAVRAELARRTLARVVIVGHSLGSAIALRLAYEHPSLVRGLVLVGAGARMRVLPEMLKAARTTPAAAAAHLTELGFAPGHEALAQRFIADAQPTAAGMLHRDLDACDHFDMMEQLGHIGQPTLILCGESDRLTPPKYARFLADHLASATLAVLPDAGHYVQVETPDAAARAMRRWLGR